MNDEQQTHPIRVNGKERVVPRGTMLAEVLQQMEIDPEKADGIAVAVNEEVVPQADWGNTVLHEEAEVEVITALQGG